MSLANLFVALTVFLLPFSASVSAQSLTVTEWRGRDVLRLSGPIVSGLADDLSRLAFEAELWPHGNRIVLLDSPGGSVVEALQIANILRNEGFHTVVPNYAKCASACGSIVFVSGALRTIEPLGSIGQHSCAMNGQADQRCNELISQHAVRMGVSYGAINAFVTLTPPDEILWFSREDVDGWGLSKYPGEEEGGFQRSEPRVIRMLTGEIPKAQSAWRLDFFGDGYRAFLRPASDAEREMQLNLFCYESLPGRLFISMEVHGPQDVLASAITEVQILTDTFGWSTAKPWIVQEDPIVSSVGVEVPREAILDFLRRTDYLEFRIDMKEPFVPMVATTFLARSRPNLIFAANNCSHGDHDLNGQPLQP